MIATLPEPGQLVDVRLRRFVVVDVVQSTLPVLATWIIRSKPSPTKLRKISFPACKQRWVGVPLDVVTSILMLERRYFQMMEKFL